PGHETRAGACSCSASRPKARELQPGGPAHGPPGRAVVLGGQHAPGPYSRKPVAAVRSRRGCDFRRALRTHLRRGREETPAAALIALSEAAGRYECKASATSSRPDIAPSLRHSTPTAR